MSKKRKLNWKPVELPNSFFGAADGLIQIEELCDYSIDSNEIIASGLPSKKRKVVSVEKLHKEDNARTVDKSFRKVKEDNSGLWIVTDQVKSQNNPPKKDLPSKTKKTKDAVKLPKHPKRFTLKTNSQNSKTKKKIVNNTLNIESSESESSHDHDEDSGSIVPVGMEAWSAWKVPLPILKALSKLGFKKPTPIQEMTLPAAIMGRRDILGAAETGSGKTLAFGIPIIYGILQQKKKAFEKQSESGETDGDEIEKDDVNSNIPTSIESDAENIDSVNGKFDKSGGKLYALILTPTRELAIQVHNHLIAVAKYTGIKIAVVVGGLASQKQERLLKKRPEIVVATPGRLWELIESGNPHLKNVGDISFLAIDETDRMLEKGHFQELQILLQSINRDEFKKQKRQNFVFSATLTMVHEPPKYLGKRKAPTQVTPAQKLQTIISSLGITNPKVVDITHEKGTAGTLSEARIICSLTEKDQYLYYFLLRHSGRTLVFCNSITCVRRLAQILEILKCNPYPIHANMQQRQRLKNLERFRDDPCGLLLATDVAARGLDIPNVQHVIHYQVPRTVESYVHRSGRTARAQKEGITVLIMEPEEAPAYLRLCNSLGRGRDLPDFPIDNDIFSAAKSRVQLALQIDKLEYTTKRTNSNHGWFQKAAKEMDILLDEEELPSKMNNEASARVKKQVNGLKRQLDALIGKPVIPRAVSVKFPNQENRKDVQLSAVQIVNGENRKKRAFVKIKK
ncbi:hypothetical protein R5R35_006911 [Gryllus longicercus]|uniref:ATP-dependent RNA helicase n=1 Tax=Gryllus longicercus TaxID=2509291 RepID=A0AAN9VIM0_9ORTH